MLEQVSDEWESVLDPDVISFIACVNPIPYHLSVQSRGTCSFFAGRLVRWKGHEVISTNKTCSRKFPQRHSGQCVSIVLAFFSRRCFNFLPEHYQSFAAALPHHTSLLGLLSTTQSQITDARTTLQEAKDTLGNKRADLVQLWTRGQTVEEMLRLLDQMCVRAFLTFT